jgi:hypothetical protein
MMVPPERILPDEPYNTYDLARETVCEVVPTEKVARKTP